MARNGPTERARRFPGLRTADSAHEFGLDGLTVATNVDITRHLKARRRSGRVKFYTGTPSAAWGDSGIVLLLSGTSLLELNPSDGTTTVRRTGLTPSSRLSAVRLVDKVYWSNGYETGVLSTGGSRRLGLPRVQTTGVNITAGRLRAGTYRYGISWQFADGQHGPLAHVQGIELPDHSGLVVGLPVHADVDIEYVNLWLTGCNGSTLFLVATAANGESSLTFQGEKRDLATPAYTLDLAPMPAFTAATMHDARLLVAHDNLLISSVPFGPELHDPISGVTPFTSRINVLASLSSGVWVGCDDQVVYLKGSSVADFAPESVASYRSVPGTMVIVPGTMILEGETHDDCAVWQTSRGVCIGFPDGRLMNATERRVTMTDALDGTGMFRRENGQAHYVSVVRT